MRTSLEISQNQLRRCRKRVVPHFTTGVTVALKDLPLEELRELAHQFNSIAKRLNDSITRMEQVELDRLTDVEFDAVKNTYLRPTVSFARKLALKCEEQCEAHEFGRSLRKQHDKENGEG